MRRPGLADAVLFGRDVAPAPALLAVPPTVELTLERTPQGDRRTGKVAAASERGLAKLRVYVDGRLTQETPLFGLRAELDITLADPGGGRWITAVALDGEGLVSLPSSVQLPARHGRAERCGPC